MNWRVENDEPIGATRHDEILHILQALALTDCDQRTLAIVAQALGLGKWWQAPANVRIEKPVYLLEVDQ